MKLLILLLFGVASFGHARVKTDLDRQQLHGRVKSITEIASDFKGDGDRFPHRRGYTADFDTQGNCRKISEYAEFSLEEHSTFSRTGEFEVTEHNYSSRGSLTKKYTCSYDSLGNLVREIEFEPDGKTAGRSFWKYDAHGNETECNQNSRSVFMNYTCLYFYDANGCVTEMQKTANNRNFSRIVVYKYDTNGRRLEEFSYTIDSALNGKKTYKYDKQGILTEINIASANGEADTRVNYPDYDDRGNWTRRIEYRGKQYTVSERTIDYY